MQGGQYNPGFPIFLLSNYDNVSYGHDGRRSQIEMYIRQI
jgi:hypothetical protein